jgi:recombination protein RecT
MLTRATDTIKHLVPAHINAERVTRVAYLAVYRDEKLRNCDSVSIVNGVVGAASLGLEIGGPSGEAYLLPFGNTATLVIGYRGLVKLARQSEQVLALEARVVYKGEKLEVAYGDRPHIDHVPDLDAEDPKDSDIVGAYAIAWILGSPHPTFVYLNRAQIEKRRKVSKQTTGPWTQWYPEQCRKTVIRQIVKLIPSSRDLERAIEIDNRFETGEAHAVLDGIDTAEQIAAHVASQTSAKTQSLKAKLTNGRVFKKKDEEAPEADKDVVLVTQDGVPEPVEPMENVRQANLALDQELQEAERAARRDAEPKRAQR